MANPDPAADYVKSVPDSFWQLMAAIYADDALLRDYLMTLSRDEFCDFFRVYYELRTELAYEAMERFVISEDTADDYADRMVAAGKEAYLDAYFQRKPLPHPEDCEDLPLLWHIFIAVYCEHVDSG